MKKINEERNGGGSVFNKLFRRVSDKIYDCKVAIYGKRKHKATNMKSAKSRDMLFYIGWISLPVLQLIIFYFVVNANSFALAFQQYNVGTGKLEWAGFANFKQIFFNMRLPGDPLGRSILTSLTFYFWSLIIGLPSALIFSYYIYKKRFASEFFRVFLFLPQILSMAVMIVFFQYFLDKAIPAIGSEYLGINIKHLFSDQSTRFGSIVFFNIWISFGTSTLMYTSAMSRIPTDITEAAAIDGITPLKEFFLITLPLIYSTITSMLIINITNIFTSRYAIFEFFGENNVPDPKLYTIGYYLLVYVLRSSGINNYPFASAAGILATLVAVPITLTVKALLEKFDPSAEV